MGERRTSLKKILLKLHNPSDSPSPSTSLCRLLKRGGRLKSGRVFCILASKRMESSEAAARRVSRIASHLAATPPNTCASSLTSMVCSSGSGMQSCGRKDSRLLFARQDCHIPTYFKELGDCLVSQGQNPGSIMQGNGRKDSRILFSRQASDTRGYFMRECLEYLVSFHNEMEETSCNSQLQSVVEKSHVSKIVPPVTNPHKGNFTYLDGEPLFARMAGEGVVQRESIQHISDVLPPVVTAKRKDVDWLPRMDIVEFRAAYVVTIELPGVRVDGIRVEVSEDRLLVSGSRLTEWRTDSMKPSEKAFYHCKELSQGPFRAQWPMPKNVNLDCVSAEFMDGFLRIFLPKHDAI